jgi:hypothetical protein
VFRVELDSYLNAQVISRHAESLGRLSFNGKPQSLSQDFAYAFGLAVKRKRKNS